MKTQIKRIFREFQIQFNGIVPTIFGFYYRYVYKPSKHRLSGRLHQFSCNHKHQINFAQIGANDGISNDPIFKLISAYHWIGIRLEPQPFVFEKLQKLHKNQPNITPMMSALGEKDGKMKMHCVSFSKKRWAHGLTSFQKDTLLKTLKNDSVKRDAIKNGDSFPANEENWIKEIEVDVLSINSLMRKVGENRLDLLVVDTEGYDLQIINLFIKDNFLPNAILYEHDNLNANEKEMCQNKLLEMGYSIGKYGANSFAVKN